MIVSGPVDFEIVAGWVEIGRKRAAAPMYQAR